MSFSSEIKEDLSKINNLNNKEVIKHELIGYLISSNTRFINKTKIKFTTESEYNINRFSRLLSNFNINHDIELQGKKYIVKFNNNLVQDIVHIDVLNKEINILEVPEKEDNIKSLVKGVFMGAGLVSSSKGKYHLELAFADEKNMNDILELLKLFGIEAKYFLKKRVFAIYLKESESISTFLALIGANKAVIKFEEMRVMKHISNNVNRIVNCETANLNKIVQAAVVEQEAIRKIEKAGKFEELSDQLKEIALLRKAHPDASLVELGSMLENPIGKSGVNHRLKKIIQIAEELS